MKKRIYILFLIFIVLLSCSSLGIRTVPESSIVSKDVIIEKGIAEVEARFGERISDRNVGIYKRGYRDWKLILYGIYNYYTVYVAEDGQIVSSEKGDYK